MNEFNVDKDKKELELDNRTKKRNELKELLRQLDDTFNKLNLVNRRNEQVELEDLKQKNQNVSELFVRKNEELTEFRDHLNRMVLKMNEFFGNYERVA